MGVRFIFFGGTRERNENGSVRQLGIAHNGAFFAAARNVEKDYKSENSGDEIKLVKISTAANMVGQINASKSGTITSLDVLCHGTPYSLNFSVKENENCGVVTGLVAEGMLMIYYSSWEDGIYSFSSDSRYVSDIDCSVFVADVRIQIHGCNAARSGMPGDTLAETLSKDLYKAGKKRSYVIGHTDKSSPNIRGGKTTIAEQDYRHGSRAIIHNGQVVGSTTKKGLLPHQDILKLIPESKP